MPARTYNVTLPRRTHEALIAYGLTSPAAEVCGLLGGHNAKLASFYPVRNIAEDPAESFLLEAEGQIDAMRRMRDAGESLRGIFHTHPDGPASPSATDLALAAYPDVYYLILSLQQAKPRLCTYYYDGQGFTPVELLVD